MTRNEFTFVSILVTNTILLGLLIVYIMHTDHSYDDYIKKIQEYDSRELYIGKYTSELTPVSTDKKTGRESRQVVSSEIVLRVAGKLGHTIDLERKINDFPAKLQGVCEAVFRGATNSDIQDLELTNIKSKLKMRLKETLNSECIDDVIISNYRVYNKAMVTD